ncbi:MAG TPA: Wzt carbohydrate-binding domain-containing protein, partial [Longimicrobiales bacterium]|nr:Wzt carbohydrate-binding domain-containing protein [Longimicrobiales bacterium]
VGSLLEVGTGFHPELTGRDNVYLNGSILGMDRRHIARQFDAIVAFAGIAPFIDTPVKRYSSGMYLRLAFAVAAHLEPDVLVVDEVLAVGDAEFQRKCLGKMDEAAQEGRTILFVSHNMNAVQRLCSRCVLLDAGTVVADGRPHEVVARYLAETADAGRAGTLAPGSWADLSKCRRSGDGRACFEAIRLASDDPAKDHRPYPDGPLEITLAIQALQATRVGSIALKLTDPHGTKLVNVDTLALGLVVHLRPGRTYVRFRIASLHLSPGTYLLGLWMANAQGKEILDQVDWAARVTVIDPQAAAIGAARPGLVACEFQADVLDGAGGALDAR